MTDPNIQIIERGPARRCAQCQGPDGCLLGMGTLYLDRTSDRLSCTLSCPPSEGGMAGLAHGGWICKIMDEILGQRVVEAVGTALTANITVHFKQPVPIETAVTVTGWIIKTDGRKITATGEMRLADDDTLLATAEALFITPRS